jgi:tetratricopeptide (TPR) repeat protein
MAEGGRISGVLGAGTEPPAEGSVSENPLDPTAAALAAELAQHDPELAQEASAYFRKQSHLVEVQTEHLHEQRVVNLQLLKLKRFDERLRVGLRVFVILFATVIGIGGVVLIRDAVTSRQVIIEPFHTPPGLAARGLDGTVVASGLLDELGRLQDATRSSVQRLDLSSAWTNQVKLEVPETGVSLGELSRLLKERFGHDVHIDGDLVEPPAGGLALTVRGNGVPPKTFSGSAAEFEQLTVAAAEYVYSKSQPARWASYLQNAGRSEEAIAFCRAAVGSVSKEDQPYLLNVWANSINNTGGPTHEALSLYRASVKVNPDFWIGYNNVMNELWLLGDEEGAWRAGALMIKIAGGRPGRASELYFQNLDTLTWNLRAWLDSTVADAEANAGVGTGTTTSGPAIADIQARLHDLEAADLALKTMPEDPHDPSIVAVAHFVRGRLAAETGDSVTAAAEMEAFGVANANPIVSTGYPGYSCWIAPAEEAAGHRDKADAVLKASGTYVDCYRFRGDILDTRGDWAAAQKAYADAVALAPDLPAGYYSWGTALARHGDLAGAEAKLREANLRGPHWADPLKAWGDVFAKQGKSKDALAKYDQALKYAPNWKQLKEAREAATK